MPETKDAKFFYLGNIFSQSKIEFLLQKNYGTKSFKISVSNDLHSQHNRCVHMPLNNYCQFLNNCYLFRMNSLDLTFYPARIQKILLIFNGSFCKNTN